MEPFIILTNQSQGRDRIFRATQYACALAKYMLRNDPTKKQMLLKLQNLESSMSSGRKLFRLGNTVNSIDAAKRTFDLSDPVLRFCLTLANISRSAYFICDNILWARNVGLIQDINKDRWNLNAMRYYFFSLVMSLARDAYVITQLMVKRSWDRQYQQKAEQHISDSPDVAGVIIPPLDAFLFLLIESLRSHPAVALDTIKNVCDIFLPLDKLGIFQTNAGVVGICGLVSSIIGILSVLKPNLKIKP
ncbi:peroxisomal membrane protein 11A [Brachyhypopomus gauderio]|uniref:peroxisomal membrane protein 11A n=1 Tax=Brachyhypopomus gauderio TaxID=698409 RepID=UPI004042541C